MHRRLTGCWLFSAPQRGGKSWQRSGAAGRMGPAQCPCLLRQREFPGRLRNGRFFESLPAMGTLPAPFGERFDAASAACAGRLAQRPAAPLRCRANPPGRDGSEMQQPILGLYTAPPRLELVVWACLGPPWPSLPAEPCDPPSGPSVGHFSLASKGTERGPHRPACGMR